MSRKFITDKSFGPFLNFNRDLICANILSRPIMELATVKKPILLLTRNLNRFEFLNDI